MAIHSPEAASARKANLQYVEDTIPGIIRKGKLGRFSYVTESGVPIRTKSTLKRIKSLVIPPAWQSVWICPHTNGHIQVTARDARGRKQYRYHIRWRETRDANKYEHLHDFVRALSKIRKSVTSHLRLKGLPRDKVLAAVVRLLERSFIRIGNERYASENGSYGLTTMRNRHVRVHGRDINFDFRGKSGKQHQVIIKDARLASLVAQCRELPGQELFQYVDENGERHKISSTDVNNYLNEISGGKEYTAKDFRTWAGTLLATVELFRRQDFETETQAKKHVVEAIKAVAQRLGNTPSICRKCYVHPGIVDSYYHKKLSMLPLGGISQIVNPNLTRRQEMAIVRLLKQNHLKSKSISRV
ncbi:MAG TPA: hypothetical protein VK658_11590 [Chryseolinea sp.]|nr:hypothetical protein [Chryseolinea sp.]